ncbi:MAG: hypothetical protein A49_05030 [Methyloceanibacter sp.]|nr:MAG: hypothetical protein A49_05030 [Methyloceanibacter sp.]
MTTLDSEPQLVDRLDEIGAKIQDVREATASVIFGQDRVIDLALVTLLSGGHALLIGVPGLAKTSLVETLGAVLGLENKRIQFTPDLMPSDIIGSEVLEEDSGGRRDFRFVKGPIFTQLLMADEINRASPKTQSALLQAMQEHHVTMAGVRHDVPQPFPRCSRPRTRWSRKARIHCRKRSSTASCCRSTCRTRTPRPNGACCSPPRAPRSAS